MMSHVISAGSATSSVHAQSRHQCMRDLLLGGLRNWARGIIYWNLALDEQYGPHFGGCDTCKGIVTIDSRTGEISRNDEYYAFAHFSRFILPGAVRVWSTDTGNDIKNVAFRNASGSVVLVLINARTEAHDVSVQQGDVHFHYTMPAQSVATLVWSPGLATAPAGASGAPAISPAPGAANAAGSADGGRGRSRHAAH